MSAADDYVMDMSLMPAGSRAPVISGVMGCVGLLLPMATLHHLLRTAPRDGTTNAVVFRILLAAWAFLTVSDVALIGYAFLTPQCANVYMHVFPSFTLEPCAANVLFPLSFACRTVGDYLCTVAMFRRFQPVLRRHVSPAVQFLVRGGPVWALLPTLVSLAWIVAIAIIPIPSGSENHLPPWMWLRSWVNHLTLLAFGVISLLCYLPAITYVKGALSEVDGVLARVPAKPSPALTTLALQERRLWRRAYCLVLACFAYLVIAVLNMLITVRVALNQPVVLQAMIIHMMFKAYLATELFLVITIKRALEINRQRTSGRPSLPKPTP